MGTLLLGMELSEKNGRFMSDTRFVQVLDESSELGGASAILLDYGKEDPPEYSSLFILPKDNSMESLESVLTGLSSELLSDLDDLPYDRADIKLPRFKIEWSASLKKELQRMGIKAAFDVNIDNKFDRMTINGWRCHPRCLDECYRAWNTGRSGDSCRDDGRSKDFGSTIGYELQSALCHCHYPSTYWHSYLHWQSRQSSTYLGRPTSDSSLSSSDSSLEIR